MSTNSILALVLALFLQAFQSQPTGTGTIAGRFLRDGQPAANAQVQVFDAPKEARTPVLGAIVGRATTDASGNFQVNGLPAGSYVVRALPGTVYYPGVTALRSATAIAVEDGKVTAEINFEAATPAAPRAATARGNPGATGAISGRLMRGAQPVPNVRIGALAAPANGARAGGIASGAVRSSGVTDASGNFRLENLPPGQFFVSDRANNRVYKLVPSR